MNRLLAKQLLLSGNYWSINKDIAKLCGVETALLLIVLAEAENMLSDVDGWFYQTVETIEEAPVIEEQEVAPIKKSQVIPANPQIINPVSDDKIILTPELTPKPDSDFQGNMMEGM